MTKKEKFYAFTTLMVVGFLVIPVWYFQQETGFLIPISFLLAGICYFRCSNIPFKLARWSFFWLSVVVFVANYYFASRLQEFNNLIYFLVLLDLIWLGLVCSLEEYFYENWT